MFENVFTLIYRNDSVAKVIINFLSNVFVEHKKIWRQILINNNYIDAHEVTKICDKDVTK